MKRGFTLVELLVVITIILIASVVALPSIVGGLSHRQVSEAARLLQASLAGARDSAIRDNGLAGIRLLPDPVVPNACNRIIPLSQPPAYSVGLVSCFPGTTYAAGVMLGTQALVLEETVQDAQGLPLEPTSWYWNVRLGDKLQINQAGPWYTVCGPAFASTTEGFVNVDPSKPSPLGHDYLLLVNGYDDNQDGYIDNGWDGVNTAWEQETWRGSMANGVTGATYSIRRRPMPGINARELPLPSNVVIDLSRSNLPAATLDLLCRPDGTWAPSLQYSVPTSIGLGGSWFQFWLAERSDMGLYEQINPTPAPLTYTQITPTGANWLISVNGRSGQISSMDQPDLVTGLHTARQQ